MKGLNYPKVVEGNGSSTILFIPGLLGDEHSFEEVGKYFLQDGYRVIRVSYPCHPFSLQDFAEQLLSELDSPSTVVGTSMGGYVAQLMARAEPGKIENLVLVNTFPSVNAMLGATRWLIRVLRFLPKGIVKGQIKRGLRDEHFGGNRKVRERIEKFIESTPASVLYYRLRALADAPEIRCFPEGIHTIVFYTKGDPTVPDSLKEQLVEKVNPHLVYEFEEGGHFPYLHNPEKFYRILKSALEE